MKQTIKRLLPKPVMRVYEAECRKETHINRALRCFDADSTYIEIGVRDGQCVHTINAGKKAAVDPAPIDTKFIESDGTQLFEMPSDEFFNTEAENWAGGKKVSVAFVDGLHEFEQALRDVLNLEPLMAKNGLIFMHDCNPPTRQNEQDMSGTWNGDVWKVPYYLSLSRPDLQYFTLDCDWGLSVIRGFSPNPTPPDQKLIARVKGLDYSVLEANRNSILALRNPLYSWFFFPRFRLFKG